jgi:nucleoside-diphosphate-sugar epimerase
MNYIIKEDIKQIIKSDIDWNRFSGKKILITGATGFLPAYMVETLMYLNLNSGINIQVYCLVRNIEKAKRRFATYLGNKNLIFIHQDICTPIEDIQDLRFIIHAASQASPKYFGTDPVGTLKANTIGTYNALELARKNTIESFLYFSSSEIYGDAGKNSINELDYGYLDCNSVRACYAESKRMGENMCKSWLCQYGIKIKIVRPFHTYGPGMDLNDGRVFADFVNNVLNDQDIVLNSNGSAKRTFCYLQDATVAFFKILLEGENGEAYNMGNPHSEISIWNLANMLVNMFPEKKIKAIKNTNHFPSGYIQSVVSGNLPDITKLNNLGWTPHISIEEGFRRTISSYSDLPGVISKSNGKINQ